MASFEKFRAALKATFKLSGALKGRSRMKQKPRFTPKVFRIKLNPEQSVLTCQCYNGGIRAPFGNAYHTNMDAACVSTSKTIAFYCPTASNQSFPFGYVYGVDAGVASS